MAVSREQLRGASPMQARIGKCRRDEAAAGASRGIVTATRTGPGYPSLHALFVEDPAQALSSQNVSNRTTS